MKPGSELDTLVAEKVMGWKLSNIKFLSRDLYEVNENEGRTFRPSTNISDAWLVVDKLDKDKKFLYVSNVASGWKCNIEANRWYAVAETAPLAICLAALKAVGVAVE